MNGNIDQSKTTDREAGKLVIFSVEYSPTEKSGIEEAGVGSRVRDVFSKAIVKPKEIVVNDFKENLSRFLQNMDDILGY